MSSYLVTGGAGFIGSNIVEELVRLGHSVRVLDNFSTGKRENIATFLKQIELIEGDIREEETCRQAVKDIDYVLHQAAMPSVPRSLKEPVTTTEINVMGTVKLLTAAAKAKVRRFVYAASSSAYGDQPVPVKREDLIPKPLSPYAAAKLAGEYFCQAYSQSMGLETVGLRYFNVFGPRQDPKSQYSAVIPLFITAIMEGRRPTIYGDGTQTRDFTYVANNVQANILATTAKSVAGKIINIACGKSYSVLDLLKVINEALGKNIDPILVPERKGDIKHSLADIELARKLLGYEMNVDFTEGIKRTVAWYLKNQSSKNKI
jgi:UDP-glucose 4-epimerase